MDPATVSGLVALTPTGMLVTAVVYFHRRDKRNDRLAEERHSACESRNTDLQKRVDVLEQRQFDRLEDLAREAIVGLARATDAVKRSMNEPITPPHSLQAIVDHHHKG